MRKYLKKFSSSILSVALFTIFVFTVVFSFIGIIALMNFLLEKPVGLLVDALTSTNYTAYIVITVIALITCMIVVIKEE